MSAGDRQRRSIRTPDQRLRAFVSSTLGELGDERRAARTAIDAGPASADPLSTVDAALRSVQARHDAAGRG